MAGFRHGVPIDRRGHPCSGNSLLRGGRSFAALHLFVLFPALLSERDADDHQEIVLSERDDFVNILGSSSSSSSKATKTSPTPSTAQPAVVHTPSNLSTSSEPAPPMQRTESMKAMDLNTPGKQQGGKAVQLWHWLFENVHLPTIINPNPCFVSGSHVLADYDGRIFKYLSHAMPKARIRNPTVATSHRFVAKLGKSVETEAELNQYDMPMEPKIDFPCGKDGWWWENEQYKNGEYAKGTLMFYQFHAKHDKKSYLFAKYEGYAAAGVSTAEKAKHTVALGKKLMGNKKPGLERNEKPITKGGEEEYYLSEESLLCARGPWQGDYRRGRAEVKDYNDHVRTGNEVFLPSTITSQFTLD